MRVSREKAQRRENVITFIAAVLTGFGAVFAASLLMAVVGTVFDLSDAALNVMSTIALAAGCFACAFVAANRRRRHGLSTGAVCGLLVFAAVIFAGALTYSVFSVGGVISKLIIIICGSCIGGIIGVNSRKYG
ncbi:MAG: TIGR04086 family membrane protein [Oscillospiraceae bacterium]|nr:TIGR04086 family membrane protein [Oscillospiraceae bacterium]